MRGTISRYLSEIGRRGGKVKGRKGFATLDEKRRREIAQAGVKARRKKASNE